MINKINPVLLADAYKYGHVFQYPEGTEYVFSNWTPRKSRIQTDTAIVLGLQSFLINLVEKFDDWFSVDFEEAMFDYTNIVFKMLGKHSIEHWKKLHDLQYLPLKFYALPEGESVPFNTPMFVVTNTHPNFGWLVNFIETWLSAELWMPSTAATIAREYRKIGIKYAKQFYGENADLDFIDWQFHDFAMRGMAGIEASCLSGVGHLTQFNGTDTSIALEFIHQYYGLQGVTAGSAGASEHSVMCAGGKDGEFETFDRLINKVYPEGIVSVVSDTWDLWKVCTEYIPRLKESILNRNGKVVLRPDCVDDITEILTDKGFKLFKDLTKEEKVAQYNEDGTVEFVKPLRYIEQWYDGGMIRFNDYYHTDVMVTPNHEMVKLLNNRVVKQKATDIKYYFNSNIIHSGLLKHGTSTLSNLERLLIAYQADGCVASRTTKAIIFNFSKKRKSERLETILNNLGLHFTKTQPKSRKNQDVFYVKIDSDLLSKTFNWVFDKLDSVDYQWCREFIEELSHWDSTIRHENRIKYDSTIKLNSEIVQVIATLAGYRTCFATYPDNRKEHFSDIHTVHITKQNYSGGQSITTSHIPYNGKVYCVEVPSNMIIIRRNNRVCVTGNSSKKDQTPADIICGDARQSSYEEKQGVLRLLAKALGTTNGLINNCGVIYGDGISPAIADDTLDRTVNQLNLSPYNVVFGIGSYTYQYNTRDTLGFAMKATAVINNGKLIEIFKDPVTDDGYKKSHKGIVTVYKGPNGYETKQQSSPEELDNCAFFKVFENGDILVDTTFSEIIERARI